MFRFCSTDELSLPQGAFPYRIAFLAPALIVQLLVAQASQPAPPCNSTPNQGYHVCTLSTNMPWPAYVAIDMAPL